MFPSMIALPDLDHCGVLFADVDHRIRLIGVSRSERREQAEGRADGGDGDDRPFASEDRARPPDPINLNSLLFSPINVVAVRVIGSAPIGPLKLRVDWRLTIFEGVFFICHRLAPFRRFGLTALFESDGFALGFALSRAAREDESVCS